ncbi:hypothetical protein KUTeg_005958 [Tegillarca granosa]|uniref:Transmembrane protein 218 n=1 Tax=Tegillarca granosa TaxID=220873 RepID=A0ABQ9FF78_TEGGR|nr:hypothetical protein KUTeg_005958 [Tegillarca granosa]
MALVLGVGIGIFVLTFFWALAVVSCIAFSRAQGGLSYAGFGIVALVSLLTVVLLVLPREPETPSLEEVIKVYDYSIIYRYLLISGCALFLLIGLIAYLVIHIMEPIYAKPIRRLRM